MGRHETECHERLEKIRFQHRFGELPLAAVRVRRGEGFGKDRVIAHPEGMEAEFLGALRHLDDGIRVRQHSQANGHVSDLHH